MKKSRLEFYQRRVLSQVLNPESHTDAESGVISVDEGAHDVTTDDRARELIWATVSPFRFDISIYIVKELVAYTIY